MAKIDMSKDPVMQELRRDNPGNSKKARIGTATPKSAEPKRAKVISGSVKTKKKGLGKKVTELFVGEDVDNVALYILHDVLVPAAKNTISDMVSGGIEMLMFGEQRGGRTRRDGNKSYISYNQPRGRTTYGGNRSIIGRSDMTARTSNRHMDDIVFETRGDAESALTAMFDILEEFHTVSVNDLYDIVGITASYTDANFGWDNLSRATVTRTREGYLLELPKAIVL